MRTREVWRIRRAGSLDELRREQEELAPPGPGEARVRVEAIGLNFADVFACLGLYSAAPKGPFVPGLECSGTIEALGEPPPTSDQRRAYAPGDRVMVLTRFGGFATALNCDTRYLLPIPDAWTSEQAAAFPVQAITAWYGLVRLGELAAGDIVLVHSAAGGVGLHALAMAQRLGAHAIGTVGHADKAEFLERERGVPRDRIIVRDPAEFGAQLEAALASLHADGLDVVFDAIAGPYFLPALARLRPEGRHVLYGAADFMPSGARPNWLKLSWQYVRRPRLDPMRLIDRNRAVFGFNLIWLFHEADRVPDAFAGARRLTTGPPHIGARFSFAELSAALRALQSGRTVGKVIVATSGTPRTSSAQPSARAGAGRRSSLPAQ